MVPRKNSRSRLVAVCAEAVRRALGSLGVSDAQVEAVSLGEEKPRCVEASENCYAENRRADILYSGEF